jgi:hypothetical protein
LDHCLQPTASVHEAYMRLVNITQVKRHRDILSAGRNPAQRPSGRSADLSLIPPGNDSGSCIGPAKNPGAATSTTLISINRFYRYPIDKGNAAKLGQYPWPEGSNRHQGFVILVAIQIMVFTLTHPLWEWMTYF